MPDLFDPDDEDWVEYQQSTPEYYLRVASEAIRTYLGWHLAPSITETLTLPVKQKGLIMLPSRFVTAVESVTIADEVLDPSSDFIWDSGGWINTGSYYFYDTPRWPNVATSWQLKEAVVEFTHGYPEVPLPVKQVAFELVKSTMTTPVSNVSQMATPAGYRISLSSPAGFNLNEGQQRLLAPYRLFGVT